jgi:pyruvate dehydrogenase E1 component
MATVRLLKDLIKDKEIGKRIVPIIPDEARTFGLDSIFPTRRSTRRTASSTTRWTASCCCRTRSRDRADPARGHQRGRRMASFTSPPDLVRDARRAMIPFYIFYSMFGFQRTGDQFWAAADQMAAASCSAPRPAARR